MTGSGPPDDKRREAIHGVTGKLDCFVAFHTTVVVRLDRTIQYAAASRLFSGVSGILGRPVKPGDDA
jgi:hypothetical protein